MILHIVMRVKGMIKMMKVQVLDYNFTEDSGGVLWSDWVPSMDSVRRIFENIYGLNGTPWIPRDFKDL